MVNDVNSKEFLVCLCLHVLRKSQKNSTQNGQLDFEKGAIKVRTSTVYTSEVIRNGDIDFETSFLYAFFIVEIHYMKHQFYEVSPIFFLQWGGYKHQRAHSQTERSSTYGLKSNSHFFRFFTPGDEKENDTRLCEYLQFSARRTGVPLYP